MTLHDPMIQRAKEANTVLRTHLKDLLTYVGTRPETDLPTWLSNLDTMAINLCRYLQDHFDIEEADGFMDAVIDEQPDHELTIKSLRLQHQVFIRELQMLIINMESITNLKQEHIGSVCQQFKSFMTSLRHHEDKEDELLMRLYLDDIGSVD